MNAEVLVRMIEEMIDLKVQQHAEASLRPSSEVAMVLQAKKETDRRRLEQIRAELVRLLRDSKPSGGSSGSPETRPSPY